MHPGEHTSALRYRTARAANGLVHGRGTDCGRNMAGPVQLRAADLLAMADPQTVDVHAHLMPPDALKGMPGDFHAVWASDGSSVCIAEGEHRRGRSTPRVLTDVDALVAAQEAHGVDMSIVGAWADAMAAPRDAAVQRDLCRHFSDALGEAVEGIPSMRWLAALPSMDGSMAAAEMASALHSGAVGGLLCAAVEQGGGLGRPDLEPLWATAEEAGFPIFVHPGVYDPSAISAAGGALVTAFFYPYLTTRAAGELLVAGVAERHPDLKVLLPHGGGFLPYHAGRFAHWLSTCPGRTPRTDALRWFYYDTVVHSRATLRFLVDVVGEAHVLAGSDCPFLMADWQVFDGSAPMPPVARQASRDQEPPLTPGLLGMNAVRLFGLEAS